jgi:hypothetical protein
MLISRRHGAERPHWHRNRGSAFLPPVADFTRTRNDEKQIPRSRVKMRCELLPGVHAEKACFRFRHLMEHGLRTSSMDIAPCFAKHIAYRDNLSLIHSPLSHRFQPLAYSFSRRVRSLHCNNRRSRESVPGQSLQVHSAPVPTNVRNASDSDKIADMPRAT